MKRKKTTFDKYLRLWNQLDAIVSPEYGNCCSYTTLPFYVTFNLWYLTSPLPYAVPSQRSNYPIPSKTRGSSGHFCWGSGIHCSWTDAGCAGVWGKPSLASLWALRVFVLNGISNSKKRNMLLMHCISFEQLLTLLKVFCYGLNFFFIFVKRILKKKFLLTILLTINAWSNGKVLSSKRYFIK